MRRVIIFLIASIIAFPVFSNEYENLWYRWTTFQDTKKDKVLYIQCGYLNNEDNRSFRDISSNYKITKKRQNKYELFYIKDDDWIKLNANISAKIATTITKKKVTIWDFSEHEKSRFVDLYSSVFYLFDEEEKENIFDQFDPVDPVKAIQPVERVLEKKGNIFDQFDEISDEISKALTLNTKLFDKRNEIQNTYDIKHELNFSNGRLRRKNMNDISNPWNAQKIKVKILKDFRENKKWALITTTDKFEINYRYDNTTDCLALKSPL